MEERGRIGILSHAQSIEMLEGSSVSQEGARCEGEVESDQTGEKWGELASLRLLFAVRRMRRANAGGVSHDAEQAGQAKVEWRLHHGFITILEGGCLKRCLYPSTSRSCLSTRKCLTEGSASGTSRVDL